MPGLDMKERTDSLIKEYGTRWSRIVSILTEEGFSREDGTPLTVDTIRKRYQRWHDEAKKEPRRESPKKVRKEPFLGKTEKTPSDTRHKTIHTTDASIPVADLIELFRGSLERRDQMLAEKLRNNTYSPGTEETIISMESRLEERLLKTLKEELVELVQDQVDQELKTMVSPGGSFERELKTLISGIIEEQGSDDLASLMEGIEVSHERPPGPGRGHRGQKRVSRFSATMDEETYSNMKALAGTFSSHLTAACQLYLRALASKSKHTK